MAEQFEEWAILELMGHRKLAGKVSEATIGGAAFIRIDVPGAASQFYSPAAVYCITPTTEELAMRIAQNHAPAPVTRWELSENVVADPPRGAAPHFDTGGMDNIIATGELAHPASWDEDEEDDEYEEPWDE